MVVSGKRADGGRERDGMRPTDAMLSMSNGSDGYKPSRHLVKVDNLPPLVKEAADENTELWLVRLPANEIGKTDLHEKRLELCIDGTEGIIGQFSGAQGQQYNIVRHSKQEMIQPYAIIPNGADPFAVRKISSQVGLVRSVNFNGTQMKNVVPKDVNVKQSEQVTSFSAENAQVSPVQRKKSKKRRKSDPS